MVTATRDALVAAAIRYAERGWPVFPCRPRGKTPATRNGLKDATTDQGLITGWWEQWPTANVAVRTGAESGLVVLDVDGDAGHAALRRLLAEHGSLPPTAAVATPSGGAHHYFRHPGGRIANSAGKLGDGLDVRGDGGYVLAPPSIGAQGRPYAVAERAGVADLPPWLLRLLRDGGNGWRQPTPASEWVAIVRDGLPEGQRNAGLARLVGYLLRRDLEEPLVAEFVHLVNARSRPPLPDCEVDQVVESISRLEQRRRRGGRR